MKSTSMILVLKSFFRLSANEYIDRWQLQADKIMERPGVMHEDDARVDPKFKTFRGLPSYEESVRGWTVTGDLIATIYRGLKSYAQIQRLGGNEEAALHYESKAEEYARYIISVGGMKRLKTIMPISWRMKT